ncbi:hypothetical protein [Amycolatopsis acidicola]|uniref:hypothetical protein n=1 Tax=Amycolatopsis acidicola TaxID=2596893 RepID=UPI001407A60F|nr:hypothetical protein [Amycolatopsis acidicola]
MSLCTVSVPDGSPNIGRADDGLRWVLSIVVRRVVPRDLAQLMNGTSIFSA